MAENDKDLALKEKEEFEEKILEAIENLKKGQTTISVEGLEVTNYGEQCTVKLRGTIFGIIDKDGNFKYNKENFKQIKETLKDEGLTIEDLGLPDLEQSIDQEKEPDEKEPDEKEPEHGKDEAEEKTEQKGEEEEPKNDIENDREKIAEELGIDPKEIYPIKRDSAFYKNHSGMFPGKDSFFYKDEQGKFRVGTRDKDGKPIEDKEHFSTKEVAQMRPVINLGDGRKNVEEKIPIQTIEMKNPAKQNGEDDVQDRFITVDKGEGGYPVFTVVEQSRETGELVGERIEITGRQYNTHEMNKSTENKRGGQTPGETAKNYEGVEKSSQANDGVQPDEVFNFKEKIVQDLVKIYGPMPDDRLETMTNDVMNRINAGERRDEAIARVGIKEREAGGRTPDEKRNRGE